METTDLGFVSCQRMVIARNVTAFSGVCKITNGSVIYNCMCSATYHGLNFSTWRWKDLMNLKKTFLRCVSVCLSVWVGLCMYILFWQGGMDMHMDIFMKTAPLFGMHSQVYFMLMKVVQHFVTVCEAPLNIVWQHVRNIVWKHNCLLVSFYYIDIFYKSRHS